jgi:hypothetical protein
LKDVLESFDARHKNLLDIFEAPAVEMEEALPMAFSPVGSHGADLSDLGRVLDLLRPLLDLLDHLGHGFPDAALQIHQVHADRNRFHPLAQDRAGQNRGGRGAVTGHVVGLPGNLTHHPRAHVLKSVLELDLLGDGDAILWSTAARDATSRK